MKVLYLIQSSLDETAKAIIAVQRKGHDVKVIDLSKGDISYDAIIEEIFDRDRVISW